MIKRILTWGGIAFLIFLVAYKSNETAAAFESLGSTIAGMAKGALDFIRSLG